MKQATLVYCVRKEEVLLGLKKKSFGAGKWNGFGGKVEPGEEVAQAAARELQEESGLVVEPARLQHIARVDFYFGQKEIFECHAFLARRWSGEMAESDEMQPRWWPLSDLPWQDMWSSDTYWLLRALAGEKIDALCRFDEAGERVEEFILRAC